MIGWLTSGGQSDGRHYPSQDRFGTGGGQATPIKDVVCDVLARVSKLLIHMH